MFLLTNSAVIYFFILNSISKKMSIEQSHSDDLSELRENSCMAAEDENILHQKYTTVHEVGAVVDGLLRRG